MKTKTIRLSLFVSFFAGLFIFLSPLAALAQDEKTDLLLNFVSGGYYEKITSGKEGTFLLELRNSSTATISDIKLSATTPEGWTITLKPSQIASINPGDFVMIDVTISPPAGTTPDNYQIPIRADTAAIHRSITSSVEVVAPKGFWWLIGGIVAVVVIAGLVFVFLRFGRQ